MDNPGSDNDYGWRTHNPGRVMSNALRRFEDRVLEWMAEEGFTDTRRAHVNLTRHLDLEGTRMTVLAKRAAMTNAAMSELIDQCESLGLVQRVTDPMDRRARIVRFTDQGLNWLSAFGKAVQRAQLEMGRLVGDEALARVLATLSTYAHDMPVPTPTAPAGQSSPHAEA